MSSLAYRPIIVVQSQPGPTASSEWTAAAAARYSPMANRITGPKFVESRVAGHQAQGLVDFRTSTRR